MPIVTDFSFQHKHPATLALDDDGDFLGLLRAFVGGEPRSNSKRTWQGAGFNMIWRPNTPGEVGPNDFFLELNLTSEELSFNEISGKTGVANRGFLQEATFLGAIGYLQTVKDRSDGSDQHFEPGVWGRVKPTTNPAEPESVFRMGSIPHGTTINLQGRAFVVNGPPQFDVANIIPFNEGAPDDGSALVDFFVPFTDVSTDSTSRTPNASVVGLTTDQLRNPNLILQQAIAGQTITKTTVIQIASDTRLLGNGPVPAPDVGGGTDNIAFLLGNPADDGKGGGKPNANAPVVTATFWVEEGANADGSTLLQLQYTQRVLLNFNNLSWPHVSVATLTPQST